MVMSNMKPKRIKPISYSLWLFVFIICCMTQVTMAQQQGQLKARVDRLQVGDSETFKLILEAGDGVQVQQPDLSVLEKDFHVLSTSTQTSMQLINGQTTRSTEIHVTLQARQVGRLTIPAIKMGQVQSDPITITVTNTPSQLDQVSPESVFIELDTEPSENGKLYVQSQLSLIVRLFYPDGLTQGNLDHPEVENAIVELLEELKYSSRRGNRNLNVLERRYAVQPERSGELTIPSIRFDGRISRASRRSLFSTGIGRRIRAASDAVTFDVVAQPAEFTGEHWLPARRLELSMEQDKTEVRLGDPVNRTIKLSAQGLSHTQLPELVAPELDGGRIYPNANEGVTVQHDRWMYAQREFQQAIVPSSVGRLVIPETRIEWWDVVNDEQQTLVIPGAEVEVLPALNGSVTTQPQILDAIAETDEAASVATPNIVYWHWSNVILAVVWLLTVLFWWLDRRRQPRQAAAQHTVDQVDLKAARKALKCACMNNQASAAMSALLEWGRALWPQQAPVNVRDVALRLGQTELIEAVQGLQDSIYAQSSRDWQGETLWRLIEPIQTAPSTPQTATTPVPSVLPALYPRP